ncbi:MAG: TIGR02452 family protein, partial [Actinomycetota bacterium]|nr:TIGR02452 family protein [Actinomycetota bacterium]
MNATLSSTLGQVEVKEPVSHGSLHLFALTGGPSEEDGLTMLEDALEGGSLRVEELDESGSVPELRVVNGGSTAVLILEGDELIGAKQNRVANSSVLVAAESELVLPVSCVERGRWS